MAQLEAKPPKKKQKKTVVSCFTACFGFSEEEPPLKPKLPPAAPSKYGMSGSKLRIKKTVPVNSSQRTAVLAGSADVVESEKAEAQRRYDNKAELKKKQPPKTKLDQLIIGSKISREKPLRDHKLIPATIASAKASPDKEKPIEAEKQVDPSEVSPDDTCSLPFCRKIDAIRAAASRGSSSLPCSHPARTSPARPVISHLSSFPTLRNLALEAPPSRCSIHKKPLLKKLDPVMGLSVVVVTLVIMILWGRLCAIFCTSAWFYFIPKFKSTASSSSSDTDPLIRMDLETEEYMKKKVVMEGFLERKRRSYISSSLI